MKFSKLVFLVLIFSLFLCLSSCDKKGTKNQKDTEQEQVEKNNMTDEKFVEYVIEYRKLEREMEEKSVELQRNPKLLEELSGKMKKLEEKYPDAASYPRKLNQEQQDELGRKVEEALQKLDSE